MLLYIFGDEPPLPRGQSTTRRRFIECRPPIDSQQFVREDARQCLGIKLRCQRARFDQSLELEPGLAQHVAVEEETRLEHRARKRGFGREEWPERIEVKVNRTARNAWVLPFSKATTGGHESQFVAEFM